MCSKKIPFMSAERELVVALVRERPIIEDKRTCSKNIDLKKQAWEDLTMAFNSYEYVSQRNSTQLKRCWENIKTLRKKELSQEAASLRRTGGGPPDAGPPSSDNIVDLICPSINLKVPDVIDSNTVELLTDLEEKRCLPDHTIELEKSQYDITTLDVKTKENVPPSWLKRKLCDNVDTPSTPSTSSKIKCREMLIEEKNETETYNLLPPQKKPLDASTSNKNLSRETLARIRRIEMNARQDQMLFELRMEREKILIQREKNNLEHEECMHKLQIQKLQLEINSLKQNHDF